MRTREQQEVKSEAPHELWAGMRKVAMVQLASELYAESKNATPI